METTTEYPAKVRQTVNLFPHWDTVDVYVSDDHKFYSIEAETSTAGNGLNTRWMQVHLDYHMSQRGKLAKGRYEEMMMDPRKFSTWQEVRTWARLGGI